MCHLVQDREVVKEMLANELPPDEYYQELREALAWKLPEADADLLDHVAPLAAAFDVATAFAMNFEIVPARPSSSQVGG